MKCFGCDVEKDPGALEVYPYEESGVSTPEPVASLFVLDCRGANSEYRVLVVCHSCFHRLANAKTRPWCNDKCRASTCGDADMFISEASWLTLSPVIPYARLPPFDGTVPDLQRWDPAFYRPLP